MQNGDAHVYHKAHFYSPKGKHYRITATIKVVNVHYANLGNGWYVSGKQSYSSLEVLARGCKHYWAGGRSGDDPGCMYAGGDYTIPHGSWQFRTTSSLHVGGFLIFNSNNETHVSTPYVLSEEFFACGKVLYNAYIYGI